MLFLGGWELGHAHCYGISNKSDCDRRNISLARIVQDNINCVQIPVKSNRPIKLGHKCPNQGVTNLSPNISYQGTIYIAVPTSIFIANLLLSPANMAAK